MNTRRCRKASFSDRPADLVQINGFVSMINTSKLASSDKRKGYKYRLYVNACFKIILKVRIGMLPSTFVYGRGILQSIHGKFYELKKKNLKSKIYL
jgi:hypothetical protein